MLDRAEQKNILTISFDKHLEPLGFTKSKILNWEKSVNNDFSEFFSIELLKGDTYVPTWGVMLKFIPRNDPKSIKDLIYDPIDYFRPFNDWGIPISTYNWKSIEEFTNKAEGLALKACNAAQEYFNKLNNLNDLVMLYKSAEAYKDYKRFNFYNYPQQVISYAFVLKKTGDITNATKYLQLYFEKYHIDEKTIQMITDKFNLL